MYYGWMMRPKVVCHPFNTPAVRYVTVVIPAKAGIQKDTGCRIKSGMTELAIRSPG
jgi:hypothetical protein